MMFLRMSEPSHTVDVTAHLFLSQAQQQPAKGLRIEPGVEGVALRRADRRPVSVHRLRRPRRIQSLRQWRATLDGVLTSAILVPEVGPPVWERPLRISLEDAPGATEASVANTEIRDLRTYDMTTVEKIQDTPDPTGFMKVAFPIMNAVFVHGAQQKGMDMLKAKAEAANAG